MIKNIIEYWRYDFPDVWFDYWLKIANRYSRKFGELRFKSPDTLTALADGTIGSEEGLSHYTSKIGTAIRWVFCGMPRCLNEDMSNGGGSFCKRRKWHLGKHGNSGLYHRW
jgi:hypothetical protein